MTNERKRIPENFTVGWGELQISIQGFTTGENTLRNQIY